MDKRVQKIIKDSGNDHHHLVRGFLQQKGWTVEMSPYYMDFATKKPREIDIVATKEWDVGGRFVGVNGKLAVRLFGDCKFIKDPVVFWFYEKQMEEAKKLAMDNSILQGESDSVLGNNSVLPPKIHHYVKDREVVKLTAKTGNIDAIYEGMNQSLHSLVFFRNENVGEADCVINYPIIIVDSFQNFYRRDDSVPEEAVPITENFQLETRYSFQDENGVQRNEYFLIDVVSLEKLEEFLKSLEKDEGEILREVLVWKLITQAKSERQTPRKQESFGDPYE